MGRDVGRHSNGNARRTVDEQVRNARRKHRRFALRTVVVFGEVYSLFVEIAEQLVRDSCHAHFRVTHRSWRVPIHRTEISLAVYKHLAHGKRLCHPDHGVVNS